MRILHPRKDFLIIEDYFSSVMAQEILEKVMKLGADPVRGFHHPSLRPNRFHEAPKYPVKKYMCLGLYWNPLDYLYHERLPSGERPFAIPEDLEGLVQRILSEFYPWSRFKPQTALVNFYTRDSSMGLHVDKDEPNHEAPVIGLNFGSDCRFFFEDEAGAMKDLRLPGNSLYVFGKSARLMRHGLGSIYAKSRSPGSEKHLGDKERLNLTIRQVLKE